MKKLLLNSFIILLLMSKTCFAALVTTMAWEVRTTGNDNNGGAYDIVSNGGTDYSQQDAAQLSLTDLATSGIGITTLTSVTGGFTAAMVDNCIQIRSGTNVTAGFYEITAYTDTNTVTLDRAPDDGVGGIASGVGGVGGGLLTITKAFDNMVGQNIVYLQSGTYAETATTIVPGSLSGRSCALIGYKTTHGEFLSTKADMPIIDGASTRATCITISQPRWFWMNIVCTGATGIGISGGATDGNLFINIRSHANADGMSGDTSWICIDCELDNNSDKGFDNAAGDPDFIHSYIHDNTSDGLYGNVGSVIYTVIDTNGGDGIYQTNYGPSLVGNVFYNNTGDAVDADQGATTDNTRFVLNNILLDNGNGMDFGSLTIQHVGFNDTFNTGTALQGSGYLDLGNNLTSDPSFNGAAAGDFSLSSSSSPVIGKGFPLVNKVGTVWNMGVDQDDHAAGGAVTTGYTWVQ